MSIGTVSADFFGPESGLNITQHDQIKPAVKDEIEQHQSRRSAVLTGIKGEVDGYGSSTNQPASGAGPSEVRRKKARVRGGLIT